METFGERLKLLREEKELSLCALERETGINHGALSRWERGERDILSHNLIKLADYFGVSADYLLGRED